MNATRATTTMTNDGAVFGTTTENPPEEDPPPRNEQRDAPTWLIALVLHLIVHIALHYARYEGTRPKNQFPINYVNYEKPGSFNYADDGL